MVPHYRGIHVILQRQKASQKTEDGPKQELPTTSQKKKTKKKKRRRLGSVNTTHKRQQSTKSRDDERAEKKKKTVGDRKHTHTKKKIAIRIIKVEYSGNSSTLCCCSAANSGFYFYDSSCLKRLQTPPPFLRLFIYLQSDRLVVCLFVFFFIRFFFSCSLSYKN